MIKNIHLYITVRIFIILILISSCVSVNQEIVRDETGNIILRCDLKNGVRDGKCYEYYPGGAVKVVSNWVAGFLEGERTYFFKTGNVESTGMFKAGERDGELVLYYETGGIKTKMFFINGRGKWLESFDEVGNLQEIQEYIYLTDEHQLNRKVVYDTDSASIHPSNVIFKESFWAQIEADRDTIDFGGFVEYEVQWISDKKGRAYSGDFDHKFNVIDSASLKDIDLDNKNKFYPAHLGTDTLRVIFEFLNYKDGNYCSIQSYLEKVFTVKEKNDNK